MTQIRPIASRLIARPDRWRRPTLRKPRGAPHLSNGDRSPPGHRVLLLPMTRPPPTRSTALITGASVGIGRELALVFARNRYDLVLVARNEQQLREVAGRCEAEGGGKARVLVKDLSVQQSAQEIFDELQADNTRVDVLVNNAGFGNWGLFAGTDLDADVRLLNVNIVALTALTKLFVRPMIERRNGRILNVASTAAFQPGPRMATYYASKA